MSTVTIDQILTAILKSEGGYVNHPNDKGGPTNMGVTQRALSEYLGRPASIDEVKRLDEATARDIFWRKYISGPRIDALPEPPRALVCDMAVLHGPKTAIRIMQRILNAAGFGPIDNDGVAGPQTRAAAELALKEMGPKLFQNAIVDERNAFFQKIVDGNPSQKVFLKGWLNRSEKFRMR